MRPLILLFLCATCSPAFAQHYGYIEYDFSALRLDSLDEREIGYQIDSVWHASGGDSLVQLAGLVRRATYRPTYGSLEFGYEASTATLSSLNNALGALGFENVSENFGAFIWGFNGKSRRGLYSLLFTFGLNNKTSNDEFDVKVSATNIDFVFGYDIINLRRLQLYPQVTLGFQGWWIEADRKETVAPGDFAGWLSQGDEPEINRSYFLLTYGAEANYHLVYSNGGSGIILGLRYGLTSDIIEGKWKMNGEKWDYNSSDRIKKSRLAFLIRFYFR